MRTTSPWARVTANVRGNHIKKTSQSLREGNGEHRRCALAARNVAEAVSGRGAQKWSPEVQLC